MLPDIGVMVGMYIVLRCTSLLNREGERAEHWTVKFVAAITFFITIYMMGDLILRGSSPNNPLPYNP